MASSISAFQFHIEMKGLAMYCCGMLVRSPEGAFVHRLRGYRSVNNDFILNMINLWVVTSIFNFCRFLESCSHFHHGERFCKMLTLPFALIKKGCLELCLMNSHRT